MSDIEALSQVMKPPYMLVSDQAGLVFPHSLLPDEEVSDLDPPGWADRDEHWSIDGLLGLYDSKLQKITTFKKGIDFVAEKQNVSADWLMYIVRIHEWGHGVFHLGIDPASARSLTSVDLASDTPLREVSRRSGHTWRLRAALLACKSSQRCVQQCQSHGGEKIECQYSWVQPDFSCIRHDVGIEIPSKSN